MLVFQFLKLSVESTSASASGIMDLLSFVYIYVMLAYTLFVVVVFFLQHAGHQTEHEP